MSLCSLHLSLETSNEVGSVVKRPAKALISLRVCAGAGRTCHIVGNLMPRPKCSKSIFKSSSACKCLHQGQLISAYSQINSVDSDKTAPHHLLKRHFKLTATSSHFIPGRVAQLVTCLATDAV